MQRRIEKKGCPKPADVMNFRILLTLSIIVVAVIAGSLRPFLSDFPTFLMTMGLIFISVGVGICIYAVNFSRPFGALSNSQFAELARKSLQDLSCEELRRLTQHYCAIRNLVKAEECSRLILARAEEGLE